MEEEEAQKEELSEKAAQKKVTNEFLDCIFEVDVPEDNLEWRLVGFGQKIVGLFAAPTPSGIIGAFKDLREAAKRATTVAVKGSAYIKGITELMKHIRDNKNKTPTLEDWKAIDNVYLIPACRSVAFMAYGDFRGCIPART